MLDKIEHLARAGFAIHWLHPKSKRPIGSDWSDQPVMSVEDLRKKYKKGNNVGVRLGKWSYISGLYLLVVDMDVRDPKKAPEALAALKELFPDYATYPTVISGSGGASRHFYILSDKSFPSKKLAHSREKRTVHDEKLGRDVKSWEWEIELFGTGKQVAIPPSIHPDTGNPYVWEREFDFDDIEFGLGPIVPSDHIAELLNIGNEEDRSGGERAQPLGMNIREIEDVLAQLPVEYYRDDRDGWLTVGFALHHESEGSDIGFKLWTDFSKDSDKFDKGDQKRVWKSFKGARRPVRMATLVTAAREAQLESEFENLDEFDDLGPEEDEVEHGNFDDILGGDPEKPSKREVKLRKADVEAQLGHVPKRVQRLNRKHAVAFVKGKTVIITEELDGTVSYGTPFELHAWYENDRVATEKSTQPVSKAWMQHKLRREYPNGIVFSPGREREGYFNFWKGFDVEEDPDASCELFLDHLKTIICSGNEEYYRYALGYFAHFVQRPGEKPGVAMVLRGKKRIGKDTIVDYFGGIIERHRVVIASQKQMVGDFNQHHANCLLLHVQEGFWAGNKQAEGMLKYIVTAEKTFIEPKGLNGFTIDSYMRIIMSSNEDWVVPATRDEGRYFVLDVSDKRKDDHDYFRALRHEMLNGGRSALLHYLLNYDLTGFEVRDVPETEALGKQKILGLKNVERFWFEILSNGEMPVELWSANNETPDWHEDHIRFSREEFYDAYRNWLRPHKFEGDVLPAVHFGRKLRDITGSKLKGVRFTKSDDSRPTGYGLPSLHACREAFTTFLDTKINWSILDLDIEIEEFEKSDDDDLM